MTSTDAHHAVAVESKTVLWYNIMINAGETQLRARERQIASEASEKNIAYLEQLPSPF